MKYAWASITKSCTNLGNFLIEYNLKNLLKEKGFNEPAFIFDAFEESSEKTINKLDSMEFVIIPGCTTLGLDGYPGIKSILGKTKVPIFNIGAAFFGETDKNHLEYFRNFAKPIATRDPEAFKTLASAGLSNKFVGCPTLFTGKAEEFKFRPIKNILFSFGIEQIKEQEDLIDRLAKLGYEITVLIQNQKQREFIEKLKVKKVVYSPENLIRELKKSQMMITGRLHGALPAIACGVPLIFIKTHEDSRFSLLDYLQIKSFSFDDKNFQKDFDDELKNFTSNKNPEIFKRVKKLRKDFLSYIDWVKKEISS